uniref:FBA_2 domain-containing protein n=1 Tax=Caenorhabditis tropicalis TaxID=1561998 RepID=A0A1I7TJE4_9PELO
MESSVNFPFFKLPDLPLLSCIRQMNTVEACRFDDAYDDYWKRIIRKETSLGDVSLILARKYIHILGPLMKGVMEKQCNNGDRWFTKTTNASEHALKLVIWILNKFSNHRLCHITFEMSIHSNNRVLDLMEILNIQKFETCRIIIPVDCEEDRANEFFYGAIEKWEANLIKTIADRKRIATMRDFLTAPVPINKRQWFSSFLEKDKHCHYMILINVVVNEHFLNSLITKWINLEYEKLIFAKIDHLNALDEEKILAEIDTVEKDKEDLMPHWNDDLFDTYTSERPLVVTNNYGEEATIWIMERNRLFLFAIWDTHAEEAAIQIMQNVVF